MDVIFPIAGRGTRLLPLTATRPKALVDVAGKPLLQHAIETVSVLKPERYFFIVNHFADMIKQWLEDNLDAEYVLLEQTCLNGQSSAVGLAANYGIRDALVYFPDMIFRADLESVRSQDADIVLFTAEVDEPYSYGIVDVQGDRVVGIEEKPQHPLSNRALLGAFYFSNFADLRTAIARQYRDDLSLRGERYLSGAICKMIDKGARVVALEADVWEDCGTISALLQANMMFLARGMDAPKKAGNVIVEPCHIDPTATVVNSIVGPYVSVGAGAKVVNSYIKDSIIGDNACIYASVLKSTVIGDHARVISHTGSCVVGDHAVLLKE